MTALEMVWMVQILSSEIQIQIAGDRDLCLFEPSVSEVELYIAWMGIIYARLEL